MTLCLSVHGEGSKWDLTHDGIVTDKSDFLLVAAMLRNSRVLATALCRLGTNTARKIHRMSSWDLDRAQITHHICGSLAWKCLKTLDLDDATSCKHPLIPALFIRSPPCSQASNWSGHKICGAQDWTGYVACDEAYLKLMRPHQLLLNAKHDSCPLSLCTHSGVLGVESCVIS